MMRRFAILLVLLLAQSAPAQVELKWKWKTNTTFWVETTTRVAQAFVVETSSEDQPAIKVPPDYKVPQDPQTDKQAREQLIRICRAAPIVRTILSRRVAAIFA